MTARDLARLICSATGSRSVTIRGGSHLDRVRSEMRSAAASILASWHWSEVEEVRPTESWYGAIVHAGPRWIEVEARLVAMVSSPVKDKVELARVVRVARTGAEDVWTVRAEL